MAYHDSTINLNQATTSLVGNVPATTVGDYLCAAIAQDDPAASYTPPAGWTQINIESISAPDGQSLTFFEFTGGAPSSPPGSYTWTAGSAGDAMVMLISVSGRTLSRSFLQGTTNNSANASPVAASFAGGTSAAGDDILVIMALDKTSGGASVWSFGTPTGTPGTFTLRQNQDPVSPAAFTGMGLGSIDNVASGATGSILDTITETSGTQQIGYLAWVVSLVAAIAGPTINTQPVQTVAFAGNTATFTVAATTSGGALSYQWTKNGSNVGTNSSSFTTPTLLNTDHLSIYRVGVTDSNGTTNSVSVYLLVIPTGTLGWVK